MKLQPFLLALFLSIARSQADTITLTVVTNPPQGGTASGAGTYTQGSAPNLQIQASNGWYISNVTFIPSGTLLQFLLTKVSLQVNGGDVTTITNDTENPPLNSDNTLTVTFAPLSPTWTQTPTDVATVTGSQVTFSADASGRRNITYQWQTNAHNLPGATNGSLILSNVSPADSGTYVIIASNAFGMTNASAGLVVRDLLVLLNGLPVVDANSTNVGPAVISLQSRFTNGPIFFTLDGSTPNPSSSLYTGPFPISTTGTLRTIAYRSDFLQTVLSDPVTLTIIPTYQLQVANNGGGLVTLNPPGGSYTNGTVVTLTATPDAGWTFMGWSGEGLGGNTLTNTITITNYATVGVMFGTTISNTVVGNGTISILPNVPLYPYASTAEVIAIPDPGNYLAFWNGPLTGSTPLYVYSPTPAISALFAPLPAGKASLTVLTSGAGSVAFALNTNLYPIGGTNLLTAYPNLGQQFLGWSGDASGTTNPFPVVLTQSKTITAHFSAISTLSLAPAKNALNFSLSGPASTVYRIDTSSNLMTWTPLLFITNFFSFTSFSDSINTNVPARMYRAVAQ